MEAVNSELVAQVIALMGRAEVSDDQLEIEVAQLVSEKITVRRLIDWIPEAFGMVLLSQLDGIHLPTSFQAKDAFDKWHSVDFKAEPVYGLAYEQGMKMHKQGPAKVFETISFRSSTVNSVNNALNAGASLKNLVLSGPALIGIPFEIYPAPKSFWKRLFG